MTEMNCAAKHARSLIASDLADSTFKCNTLT